MLSLQFKIWGSLNSLKTWKYFAEQTFQSKTLQYCHFPPVCWKHICACSKLLSPSFLCIVNSFTIITTIKITAITIIRSPMYWPNHWNDNSDHLDHRLIKMFTMLQIASENQWKDNQRWEETKSDIWRQFPQSAQLLLRRLMVMIAGWDEIKKFATKRVVF